MMSLLPLFWIMIIAFCVVMYVVLDGFTLGTGMLLPFMSREERGLAISVILPTWDGNQTWLVLGMASLYGAFPLAFSALLPVLYLPLILMVLSLLLRGVAFEFRLKAKEKQHLWDGLFAFASLAAALIQGLIVGNFVKGFMIKQQPYLMSEGHLVTWFTLFTALSLVVGYCLLGATRLIIKTEGGLQAKMYKFALWFAVGLMAAIVIVSIWTPYINDMIFKRWFDKQHWLYLAVLPYLTLLAFVILLVTLLNRKERVPYWCSVILFLCPYAGFIISLFPFIVPYQITLWQAASPSGSLLFMLVGACVMLPVLVIYTGYSYYIFRGKVKTVIHY